MPSQTFSEKRNVRAMSAPLVQRARIRSWAIASPLTRMLPIACTRAAERRAARRLGEDEVERRGKAGADRLVALLERAVVGFVQLADPRRVAAAAEVLEQQRVMQLVPLGVGQAEHLADPAADPAGADAMAGGLPLGDVERIAERAEQFGERNRRRAGSRDPLMQHRPSFRQRRPVTRRQ